jgi:hypothetical protein
MNKDTRLSQADELKKIEFEIYQAKKKFFKMNKELRYYQFTGIEIIHSEVMLAGVRTHFDLIGRFHDWRKKRMLKAIANKNREA